MCVCKSICLCLFCICMSESVYLYLCVSANLLVSVYLCQCLCVHIRGLNTGVRLISGQWHTHLPACPVRSLHACFCGHRPLHYSCGAAVPSPPGGLLPGYPAGQHGAVVGLVAGLRCSGHQREAAGPLSGHRSFIAQKGGTSPHPRAPPRRSGQLQHMLF